MTTVCGWTKCQDRSVDRIRMRLATVRLDSRMEKDRVGMSGQDGKDRTRMRKKLRYMEQRE